MSPSGNVLWHSLRSAVRRLRREGIAAVALAVATLVPAVLVLAWIWGPDRWAVRGIGPLVLLGGAVTAAVVAAVLLVRRWVLPVDDRAVAAAAERRRGLPQGTLSGVLELGRELSPGTSAALLHRAEADVAGRLAESTSRDLSGDLGDGARRRLGRLAVAGVLLVLVAGAAGFATPDRARGAWAPLLHPVAHLSGPTLPALVVEPGHADVSRGSVLELEIVAQYRSRATVHWRATGDVPRQRTLPVDRGRAAGSIGPVDAPLTYWVETPDGAVSERYRVRPVDPLLVSGLVLDVTYPPHVDRPPDHYEGEPPSLRVPEGTHIAIRGTATRPLGAATLRREDGRELAMSTNGADFDVGWRPDSTASGVWAWSLEDVRGGQASSAPAPLELRVLPDLAPEVRITLPGRDTVMPAGHRVQVVAEASDDYGLTAAELVFWRVTARGETGPAVRMPFRLDAGADRVQLRGVLDATAESLVPGDAVHYRVAARDNSPAGQVGVSSTYVLRLPGMAELRERARSESEDLLSEAQRLAERTRSLEGATRDLSRQAAGRRGEPRQGSGGGRPGSQDQLGFEESGAARQLMDEHEDVLARIAELEARMNELERALEAAGLGDPELQRRLAEMRELYRELTDPRRAGELERLQQAVDALDPEAVRQALERLAAQQQEFRQQIEETLALMRRAAAEQEMASLTREAEEIAAQQDALARAMREDLPPGEAGEGAVSAERRDQGDGARTGEAARSEPADARASAPSASSPEAGQPQAPSPSAEGAAGAEEAGDSVASGAQPQGTPQAPQLPAPENPLDRARQQDELAERARKLNESLDALQKQLLQMGETDASSQTGAAQEKGESAQESMSRAADQAREQQGERASQSGEQAASQMGEAAEALDRARQQMSQGGRQQMEQAVQQATQEALSLAQQEEALRQRMEEMQQQGGQQAEGMQQMQSDQAALQQGLQQLGRNLSEAGQRSAMLDREVGQALARAMLNMDQTMQAMQDGRGMPVQQAERTVDALNQLAMALLQNDARIQQSQAPGGLQQAMQQLAQLAQEQASLNGQVGALAPLELNRQAMGQQLQQMGQQQRGVARRMGEVSEMMGGSDHVLGRLDALSREAEQIAAALEGGRLDPDVMARQERLFHRLLDAGRSLERDEYEDERVGERAGAVETAVPEALDPTLLDTGLRYPAPTAEQLRSLPPAYRRLILEYFDRLNRPGASETRAPAGAPDGQGGGG